MLRFLIFLILLATISLNANQPIFDTIEIKDRERLETFFHYLINNSIIGYTLCGEKPVSIETFPSISKLPAQHAVKLMTKCQGYYILWNGWEVWNKYSEKFPSSKFVIRFIPKLNTLFIINKIEAKKVIENNLDIFHKYYRVQSADKILDEICFSQEAVEIFSKTVLLGILLGYGRNNSIAFSNKSFFQKLERFQLYEGDLHLYSILNPGFFIINNGTNDKENRQITLSLRKAKNSIQNNFKNDHYFETFIKYFTQ